MNLLYNLAIHSLRTGAKVYAGKSSKIKTMLAGQSETLARIDVARRRLGIDGFDLWIHVASLGEFEQARPLIEKIRASRPDVRILLSFFSPSGYTVRQDYPLVDCVVYLPFDTPAAARSFIDAANPRMVVFVKYEFWGNFLTMLHARNIPVYLISAIFRRGQIFFRPWGGTFRKILRQFSHIFIQDEASERLLASIGILNTTVAGDTRFDRVARIADDAVDVDAIRRWTSDARFVFVAGSSWTPDEDRYIPWLNAHDDVKAIIAPHEFDAGRLKDIQGALSCKSVLWTSVADSGAIPEDARVLVIDTFGLLSRIYKYASVALVGGGFGVGIHNINEAAAHSVPVIFGPNHSKFKEAGDLIANGGGFEYVDRASFERIIDSLYCDDSARKAAGKSAGAYIRSSIGATDKIYSYICSQDR